MAFTTALTVSGRNYPAAYVKATIRNSNSVQTVIQLQVWETQALREAGIPNLVWPDDLRTLATTTQVSDNPVQYGYELLEASDEFPNATWNI